MKTPFLHLLGTNFDIRVFRHRKHVYHIHVYGGVFEGTAKYGLRGISVMEAEEMV